MVEFASGRMTPEAARQRMLATTQEQLASLTNDPAFHAWQARKARRENQARVATNALAVAACVALAVTMALLKPAANAAPAQVLPANDDIFVAAAASDAMAWLHAGTTDEQCALDDPVGLAAAAAAAEAQRELEATQARLQAAQAEAVVGAEAQRELGLAQARLQAALAEAAVAQDAATDLAVRLREAEQGRDEAAARLSQLEAEATAKDAESRESEVAAAELLAHLTAQLERMRKELSAAEAAATAAANLAEASAAAASAMLSAPAREGTLTPAELEAVQLLDDPPTFSNTPSLALAPAPGLASAVFAQPLTLVVAGAAACTFALAAMLLHVRSRRRAAAEAAKAASLAARLKEAVFAKDTAEQSLGLLERELQRRMKQLGEVQQAAADAASPKIGTAPSPPVPGVTALHTPGRGELPPPPASLVEKFLRDHNFLAVQQEQMTEWLEMEQQFGEMQAALSELQDTLADKDAQIAAYEKDLSSANEHTSNELRSREDQLAQARAWLDEAQEQLLETQAALQEREAECRRVSSQLEAMQTMAGDAQDGTLLQQNLALVVQLQSVTAAYEALREKLMAANGTPLMRSRPTSAASTVPDTPADLSREVQNCLEMMRATRSHLADRLEHSQGVCEALIADCQGQASCASSGRASGRQADECGDQSPEPAPFGSPAAVTPQPTAVENNPLFEAEGWEGEDDLVATPSAEAGAAAEEEEEPAVLCASSRHNASLAAAPSPAASKSPPVSSPSGCSMRAAWRDAHARVAEARAQCNSWDLAGFVRELGFQFDDEEEGAAEGAQPIDRAGFDSLKDRAVGALAAAASGAATSPARALAGEALQAVQEWEFPAQRINTPPPSPFWRMLGLQA